MSGAAATRPTSRATATVLVGLLSLALACLSLVACEGEANDDSGELTVFAAASLRDVLAALEAAWSVDHPGLELRVALDGSNVLAAQIAEGAPADIFVSADPEQAQALLDAGHASGPLLPFASTRVALVAPLVSDRVRAADDLAAPGVRLVAAGPGVPITRYAQAALAQLGQRQADPEAFTAAVAANVVSREDNVRAALAKVELGEGDAAFVYHTDALSSEDVREIPLEGVDVVAEYAVLQVVDTAAASELAAWLVDADAAAVLENAGFEAPTR